MKRFVSILLSLIFVLSFASCTGDGKLFNGIGDGAMYGVTDADGLKFVCDIAARGETIKGDVSVRLEGKEAREVFDLLSGMEFYDFNSKNTYDHALHVSFSYLDGEKEASGALDTSVRYKVYPTDCVYREGFDIESEPQFTTYEGIFDRLIALSGNELEGVIPIPVGNATNSISYTCNVYRVSAGAESNIFSQEDISALNMLMSLDPKNAEYIYKTLENRQFESNSKDTGYSDNAYLLVLGKYDNAGRYIENGNNIYAGVYYIYSNTTAVKREMPKGGTYGMNYSAGAADIYSRVDKLVNSEDERSELVCTMTSVSPSGEEKEVTLRGVSASEIAQKLNTLKITTRNDDHVASESFITIELDYRYADGSSKAMRYEINSEGFIKRTPISPGGATQYIGRSEGLYEEFLKMVKEG